MSTFSIALPCFSVHVKAIGHAALEDGLTSSHQSHQELVNILQLPYFCKQKNMQMSCVTYISPAQCLVVDCKVLIILFSHVRTT